MVRHSFLNLVCADDWVEVHLILAGICFGSLSSFALKLSSLSFWFSANEPTVALKMIVEFFAFNQWNLLVFKKNHNYFPIWWNLFCTFFFCMKTQSIGVRTLLLKNSTKVFELRDWFGDAFSI